MTGVIGVNKLYKEFSISIHSGQFDIPNCGLKMYMDKQQLKNVSFINRGFIAGHILLDCNTLYKCT